MKSLTRYLFMLSLFALVGCGTLPDPFYTGSLVGSLAYKVHEQNYDNPAMNHTMVVRRVFIQVPTMKTFYSIALDYTISNEKKEEQISYYSLYIRHLGKKLLDWDDTIRIEMDGTATELPLSEVDSDYISGGVYGSTYISGSYEETTDTVIPGELVKQLGSATHVRMVFSNLPAVISPEGLANIKRFYEENSMAEPLQ